MGYTKHEITMHGIGARYRDLGEDDEYANDMANPGHIFENRVYQEYEFWFGTWGNGVWQ